MLLCTRRSLAAIAGLLLLALGLLYLSGCAGRVQAADLMQGILPKAVSGKSADPEFTGTAAAFSLALLKKSLDPENNSLVSPVSVLLALAMTANGADTETLAQMEKVLGKDIPLADLNQYLYSFIRGLPSSEKAKLSIANSIWFREEENRLQVEPQFLQTNADYYGAAAYKAAFDGQTLKDINNWVRNNTQGMIEKILDEIHPDAVMYLLNAITFDAQWEIIYRQENIRPGDFTPEVGPLEKAEYMVSEEDTYIETPWATGFIKPYAGGYSFVALLPKGRIQDLLHSLTGESFSQAIAEAEKTLVTASLPKFTYDYTVQLNECLKELGMPAAFSPTQADFSRLGKSARGNIFIGEVLHKTFIQVDERGTKAGAVTKVEMRDEAYIETKVVELNRPFLYAIIDNATGLPVFMGTLMHTE